MARSMFCIMITSMLFMSMVIAGSAVDYKNNPTQDDQLVIPNLHGEEKENTSSEPEFEEVLGDLAQESENLIEGQQYYGNGAPKPKQDQYHNDPTKVNYYNPNNHENEYIGIQGLILCKSGQSSFPLVGAVVRITCLAEDENGYEGAPFYIESHESDEKGFFFASFSLPEAIGSSDSRLKQCKVFLEDSPLDSCQVPTDVNNGISGAILSSPRSLPEKSMILFTVGPFFYDSEPNYSTPVNGNEGHY